jgi:predicted nucleotidyltransferase
MPVSAVPVVENLKTVFRQLEATPMLDDVVLAYLFGSQARGQAGPLSDIDVAVLLADTVAEADAFELRLALMDEITYHLRTNAVDVLVLNHAPLALAYRVLRDGVLIYCRDEAKRVEFTARTVNMYLDFEPFLERHEHAILERARKGELLNGHNPHRGALERYRQLRERLKGHAEPDVR